MPFSKRLIDTGIQERADIDALEVTTADHTSQLAQIDDQLYFALSGVATAYDGVVPTATEVVCDVSDIDSLIFNKTQGYDVSVSAYGQLTGLSWVLLPVNNLHTGNSLTKIVDNGEYRINAKEYDSIKFVNTNSYNTNSTLLASAYVDTLASEMPLKTRNAFTTKKPEQSTLTTITTALNIIAVHNGKLYAASSETIKRSNDWGVDNFPTTVATVTGTGLIYKMLWLDNDNILVWGASGKVYISTDLMATWSLAIDMGAAPTSDHFGAKAYKNYVMFGQYSNVVDAATKFYISEDYGVTITEIFDIYDQVGWGAEAGIKKHTHSCAIDPYETTTDGKPMLWVCIGDGGSIQMYFWSKDFGTTWNKVAEKSFAPVQATEIIPLKNCVLFVSDARFVGVVRYNRPSVGTLVSQKMVFETPLVLFEGWGKVAGTDVPLGSTPAIDYDNSLAYFGWAVPGNAETGNAVDDTLLYGQVYATDGFDFYEVYKHGSAVAGDGVMAIYGPDTDADNSIIAKINGVGAIRLNGKMWEPELGKIDTRLAAIQTQITEKTPYGVYTGLVVSAQGTPDMTVQVAAGTVYMATGTRYELDADASVAVAAADATHPRIDIIYVTALGVISYVAGVAAASPTKAATPAGGFLLATINVAANVTEVVAANIADRRKQLTTEPWIYPVLQNGWVNYGAPYDDVAYYKDLCNEVHNKGAAKNGTLPGTVFTYEPGYRPTGQRDFACFTNGSALAKVYVAAVGSVNVQTGNNVLITLNGISFKAEQ